MNKHKSNKIKENSNTGTWSWERSPLLKILVRSHKSDTPANNQLERISPCGGTPSLLGFVRTRVLMSRSRLNNRATMEADILTFIGILTPEAARVASCVPFDITISLSWFPLLCLHYIPLYHRGRDTSSWFRAVTLLARPAESPNVDFCF